MKFCSLCMLLFISSIIPKSFSSEEIQIDGSQDPLFLNLKKIEVVAYNEHRETVFRSFGESLDEGLDAIDKGEKNYNILSREEWAAMEKDIKQQILPQLPSHLEEAEKKEMIDGIILDIRKKHTEPAISFVILKKAFPDVKKLGKDKKIVVLYIPKDGCKECGQEEIMKSFHYLENKFKNIVFVKASIN